MAKKGVKKKSSHSGTRKKNSLVSGNTERLLVENFVSLQKVMANLTSKFDELSGQISELLKLFEDSARVIVKNEMAQKKEDKGEKQMLETMLSILDQNKIIAKGLTLMYETMTGTEEKAPMRSFQKTPPIEKKKMVKESNSYSSSPSTPEHPGIYPLER
ncbi:MAG: hypothetical protein KKB62_03810 [Nanoarchaeota archaeon]|nr:hypothetical protein [Nanoarchaeota archaeon]